jgi:hypothetical protein
MIQTKTSFFGGLFLKSAATSALALSSVAGGVILSGGEAKANQCQFTGGVVTDCQQGIPYIDWHETNPVPTDKEIKFISGPTVGSGDIEWAWIDVSGNGDWRIPPDPHSVDEWHVDVDFNPDHIPPAADSILIYRIRVTEPNYYFEDVTLATIFGAPQAGPKSYTQKDVYLPDGTTLIGSLKQFEDEGKKTLDLTHFHLNELYIVDTASAQSDNIDAYQNSYRQTPGPLPILGAGAAFGFSRKLRGRIKASRTA